jgi:type I restriction enzyme S subunit
MSSVDEIPNGWVETTLGDVCKIKYGKDHKKLEDGDIPCYGSGGIMRYVDSILYDKPSVLIPRKGTLSNLFFINEPFWTVDTLFYTQIDESIIKSNYLYYKLKTYNLADLNVGSAVPSLTTSVLNQLPFSIPKDIEEQKAIANILSAFDDKIENLQAQNKTLEQTAQTIFKEWFGKYQVGDELPQGWSVDSLENLSEEITRGFTTKYVEKSNLINLNQKVNKGTYLDKQHFKFYSDDTEVPKNKIIQKYDILLNSLGQGTLGRVHLYTEETDNIIADQHVSILRFGENFSFYVYQTLSSSYGQFRLENEITGSTGMLMLNISKVREFKIIVPSKEYLVNYKNAVKPLYSKLELNNSNIQTLKKTRDTLLPKLLSGKVRVNDFKD